MNFQCALGIYSFASKRWAKSWSRTQYNHWAHTLRSLNAPIQIASKSDSETSVTASDWIGAFKGPNVGTQRFSRISPLPQPLRLTLVRERENLWVPGYTSNCDYDKKMRGRTRAQSPLSWRGFPRFLPSSTALPRQKKVVILDEVTIMIWAFLILQHSLALETHIPVLIHAKR